MIKVKLVYRNYKPLHSMFSTYAECPPKGVEIDIPAPKSQTKFLSKLHLVQRKFGDYFIMKWLLSHVIDPFFFGSSTSSKQDPDIDLFHFLNMTPSGQLERPYIIEFEHIGMLFGYGNEDQLQKAKEALLSDWCKAIICASRAAQDSLKEFLEVDYELVETKTYQVYPAICDKYVAPIEKKKHEKINVLFVGNLCYLKGLEEVFMALEAEPNLKDKMTIDVISNDAGGLIAKYPNLSGIIKSYMPRFSKKEILDKFYSNADVLLMPTKRDTFGFAVVDAIASGLPVISTKQFAIPELIDDSKDGILIDLTSPTLARGIYVGKKEIAADMVSNPDLKLVEGLRLVLNNLVAGKYDLEKMSKACFLKVKPGGKFSSERRNEQLEKIYAKAISAGQA